MTGINKGVPTQYNGTLFRSRLEARWAVVFDALKWPWAYEPLDLDFYLPDFALLLAKPIAVEIKPELELRALHRHARHIISSGWAGEALALGATVFGTDILGAFLERDGAEHITGPARLFQCIDCGAVSVHNADHGWACRVGGCYAGNAHVGQIEPDFLRAIWTDAGNRVQWKGPGR